MISNFFFAFIFSFIGSIPPGTINLSVFQLGLEKKVPQAFRFAAAAALVEYPYAWLALTLESYLLDAPLVIKNFRLIAAIVMLTLGTLTLITIRKPSKAISRFEQSSFRRGLILGILNPMTLPFWIGITAYLEGNNWVHFGSVFQMHAYLLGVTLGGFSMLILLALAANSVFSRFNQITWVKAIPGVTLVCLGIYSLIRYFTEGG